MKIAFVAYDRPGYRAGPIVNARRLLPELVRRGHQVTALILYHDGESPAAEYLAQSGVDVRTSPWLGTTQRHIRWMLKAIRDCQPDVFVPNISTAGWFAARWCREAGIPAIAAFRSDDAYYWGMVDQFVTGSAEWAVSGCVCVSESLQRQLQQRKPQRTILCRIPSGVPIPDRSASREFEPGFRIAYVGRLEDEQKRITDTIAAFIKLVKLREDVSVSVIGSGSRENVIRAMVQAEGLGNRIRFVGVLSPGDLHAELVSHHAIALLSDYEGLPGAIMDGMACGLVPVCLRIDGMEELIKHKVTGVLVNDRMGQFHSAVEELIEDPVGWQNLSSAARKHVSDGYSLSAAADEWEKCCRELLAASGPRTSLQIPIRCDLPHVHSALAREDNRSLLKYKILEVALATKRRLSPAKW